MEEKLVKNEELNWHAPMYQTTTYNKSAYNKIIECGFQFWG